MDVLGWIWWGIAKVVGFVWSFVWFLLGGWVSTLLQLVILVGAVFAMKYGWRQAPMEMWNRVRPLGRFAWTWARTRESVPASTAAAARPPVVREVVRVVRAKQIGDISASTLLTVAMLTGLLVAGAL